MKVCAIIPAAGQGVRMGGTVAKQFLELDGKPILHHTLSAFEQCGRVESVTLVVPAGDLAATRERYQGGIVRNVVEGGRERQDSVFNGLSSLDPDTRIVIVHDGVRPFVTRDLIEASIDMADQHGGAIAAVPVSDTLKRVNGEGFIAETVNRDGLWRVQTPQTFRYELLKEAMEKAFAESFYGTDEGMLLERLGHPVKIIPGSEFNIKITRPEDLVLGQRIAEKRGGAP